MDNNEFLENLRKQSRPGFNKLERDWYFNRFQAEAGKIEALKQLAEQISKALNEPLDQVTSWIVRSSANDTEAMGKLTKWLPDIARLEDEAKRSNQAASRDMAGMILCSRLSLEWVVNHKERLEETYLIEFPNADWEGLQSQKPSKFLGSEGRWKVINAITDMLPGSIIEEIADYAMNELFDGKRPEPEPEEAPEDVIKKPVPESSEPERIGLDSMSISGGSTLPSAS
ncbi:hypothetical protein N836_31345 [Leptolyngbya sp. Heron Island J]|uniref:hypothetical protein n=1 Tax=Leptolyngbya sp. Heron Island J TaxID=1385935 RepID=UPI0003B9F8BF|nr:hypothetical protein [Leptolyngbya sp. Heron Island J]ESA38437.1 hypothetical protein N836_31345 [Leptolyngbya sp. Heron Island J]